MKETVCYNMPLVNSWLTHAVVSVVLKEEEKKRDTSEEVSEVPFWYFYLVRFRTIIPKSRFSLQGL